MLLCLSPTISSPIYFFNEGDYMSEYIKASESVTEGHPDKLCDRIAANILDHATEASLAVGKQPNVAMEVLAKGTQDGGMLTLAGEVTLPTGVSLDYESIARETIRSIGYTKPEYGFHHGLKNLALFITQQSSDIALGFNGKGKTGAGDQGFMIGGAVAEDGPEFMPLPIMISHALTNAHTEAFKNGSIPHLRPDGKSQVVVKYVNDRPKSIEQVTIAASHDPDIQEKELREMIYQLLVLPVLDRFGFSIDPDHQLIVNGTGSFIQCGPLADAGLTNRKIIVDSYGGFFSHGGGGFNGKDWKKVDVTGAVGARYVAKELVAMKLARQVQIEVSYTIGRPDPHAISVFTFDTENVPVEKIQRIAKNVLDLSVDGIINGLQLARPIYWETSAGGWFGRREFPWEQVPSL
jgi:S-adenosylmethionine synthetase